MRVTRLGTPKALLTAGQLGQSGGVPAGGLASQVLTATGSNGGVYWGENVRRITANGSNILVSPDVNIASGSNVVFSIASNTLTIAATGGGGGSALTVQDEGTPLSGDATALNFVGTGVTASGTGGTKTITVSSGGSGTAYGQVVDYPTSFTGDVINGSSTTPFVDVAAFDTKQVLNSRILNLKTLGASKDQRVRVTLGTTKAAAFDVRACVAFEAMWFSAVDDTYLEVRGSTSGDAQLFLWRLSSMGLAGGTDNRFLRLRATDAAAFGSLYERNEPIVPLGTDLTLRVVRDGSDVLTFYYGLSNAPMALQSIRERNTGTYGKPYNPTESGTLARIEIAIHTPAGPNAAQLAEAFVDYVASV